MTGWKLFKKRFLDDLIYQRKILGTVINWTVWVYIFVPFAIFIAILYADIWQNINSYWIDSLPHYLVIVLLLLLALSGRFRSYMQEADQLFLLDRLMIYRGMRESAFWYSLFQIACSTVLLLLIFLPWLVQLLGLEGRQLLFLYTFLLSFRMVFATIKQSFHTPVNRGFILIIYLISAVYLAVNVSYQVLFVIGALVIILLLAWQYLSIIPTKRFFLHEVSEENKERVRYAKLIIGAARDVHKTPIRQGKRPLILRKSKRLFRSRTPDNGLFELLLKGFFRHSVFFRSYLQVIGSTFFAIIMLPIWLKWIVFLLFLLFLNYNSWLRGLYERLLDQPFFSVVPVQKEVREAVWLRFKRLLSVPAAFFIGIITILATFLSI